MLSTSALATMTRTWQGLVGCWSRELGRDATLRLPRRHGGQWLRVEQGQVVVTLEGDLEDHVLGPGEELVLSGEKLAVAWALEPSRLAGGELRGAHEVRLRPLEVAASGR
jgi:hypothetical protein